MECVDKQNSSHSRICLTSRGWRCSLEFTAQARVTTTIINATTFICYRDAKHQVDVADQKYTVVIYGKRHDLFFLSETVRWGISSPFCTESETLTRIMSNNIIPSLMNLPVEFIYRILDCLNPLDILISTWNVCRQLDQIIETYHAYQVNFTMRHGEDVRRYLFGICAEQTSHAENNHVSF